MCFNRHPHTRTHRRARPKQMVTNNLNKKSPLFLFRKLLFLLLPIPSSVRGEEGESLDSHSSHWNVERLHYSEFPLTLWGSDSGSDTLLLTHKTKWYKLRFIVWCCLWWYIFNSFFSFIHLFTHSFIHSLIH